MLEVEYGRTFTFTIVNRLKLFLPVVACPLDFIWSLIQVAEMHGELMEFNELLQRQLIIREAQLKRVTNELVNLRGPVSSSQGHHLEHWYRLVQLPNIYGRGQSVVMGAIQNLEDKAEGTGTQKIKHSTVLSPCHTHR